MSHRPYPNAARAGAQIRRAASVPRCRLCRHSVAAHTLVGGVRLCTRSRDGVSCRDCARALKELPLIAGLAQFAMAFQAPRSGPLELVGAAVYRD